MSYVNPFHYALTALLFFAAVFFAAASAGETNLYGGLIVPPIAWSTPPKPPKTGDFKDDLKHPTTNAFITRYRLFVPEKLPKKRHLALLICFHGRGGNEDGPAELMNRTVKDIGLSDQYIVMGLKSHEIGWEDADEIDVLKAYDWVSSVYPIDLRRVYLIGYSSGAHWDTHFGSKHIDLFAGIILNTAVGI